MSRLRVRLNLRSIETAECSFRPFNPCQFVAEDDYQADPAASKAKLAEAAKVLWEAKYDADYKRGAALIVESNTLDKSALQARKMLEVAQRDGMHLLNDNENRSI